MWAGVTLQVRTRVGVQMGSRMRLQVRGVAMAVQAGEV